MGSVVEGSGTKLEARDASALPSEALFAQGAYRSMTYPVGASWGEDRHCGRGDSKGVKEDCEFGERFAVVQSMLALLLQSLEAPSHGSGMCEGTGRCERHSNGETQ